MQRKVPVDTHIDNTGFGSNSNMEGTRLTNKDGSINMIKTGLPFITRLSIYHSLLRMPRFRFWAMILLFYTTVNLFFAAIYYAIGVDQLAGGTLGESVFARFMKAFFFSSQTLTTVGYGHVSPEGMVANLVASCEAFIGILAFAVVTGLVYGRFTRPRAFILFSNNMLVSPYKGGRAIMFRLATYKNNHLTDAEATVTAAIHTREEGKETTKFYSLKLEITRLNSLALSWTIVHPLNEESPFYSYSHEQLMAGKLELMVTVKAFDDHFSNTVQQRTSYTAAELVYGAKFRPMFERAAAGAATVLQLDKINDYEQVALNEGTLESLGVKP